MRNSNSTCNLNFCARSTRNRESRIFLTNLILRSAGVNGLDGTAGEFRRGVVVVCDRHRRSDRFALGRERSRCGFAGSGGAGPRIARNFGAGRGAARHVPGGGSGTACHIDGFGRRRASAAGDGRTVYLQRRALDGVTIHDKGRSKGAGCRIGARGLLYSDTGRLKFRGIRERP